MAKKRLSELMLARVAPPRTGRLELADAALPGLSLRITPDGTRTFALRYRVEGQQRRFTIGRYDPDNLNLVAARERARDALKMVDRGVDPAKAKPEAEVGRGTVAEVVADFAVRHLRRNTKRASDVEQMLRRDVVRCWGERAMASITRRDVLDLLDEVVDRGSPVTANRLLSWIKTLFAWAVDRGVIEINPAAGIKPPHKERPRDRTLSDDELRRVWGAFDRMGHPFGDLGKLLILTAQRRGEVASMRWDRIDFDAAAWRLESTDTKAAREHIVPLTSQVLEILRQVPRFERSPLVIPASRLSSDRPVSGFSQALTTAKRLSGVDGWHWHDLRRSATTGMARLSIPPHICERVLNHSAGRTLSQIARVYNVHSYGDEVRRALEAWAGEVERIVTGQPAKVVALRR
jgi:integrase